ncbi:MAG TPA: DNA adenine methylase [Aggregatilineales bacterium]|nr:DNA adenine methylase [Aggregatilineales bacterium]
MNKCPAYNANFRTPLRYPGGKGRLTGFIKLVFEQNELLDGHYMEPYAGGAGLAINLLLLQYASCIHLNDIDRSVFAFWHSVLNSTDELCKRIRDVRINMTEWRKQRAIQQDRKNQELLELGFSTFFLNRTNRSGIITGGVIGGKHQDGKWKIGARFNKKDLCKRIEKIALYRLRIRLYNLDASDLITGVVPALPQKSLIYLDPPYYFNSQKLYQNTYTHRDHGVIAKLVKGKICVPWIVSYDNTPQIIGLYRGCQTITYGMEYSAQDHHKGKEAMFFSKGLTIPDVENPSKCRAA